MTKAQVQSLIADGECLLCMGAVGGGSFSGGSGGSGGIADVLVISVSEQILIDIGTPPTPPFDPTACQDTNLTNGGGNTFECYDEGFYNTSMPTAGTLISALYVANNPSLVGDTFEDYSVGAYAGGTPGASVTGYGTIYVS